jgi:glucosamine--fructose-6-phosphate aminotransferase (isomerizing)
MQRERDTIHALAREITRRPIDRAVIAGCGDSWFCGQGVRHAWELLTGWPTEAVQALDYARYGVLTAGPATLAVGLSAGGNTPAVMEALSAARQRGALAIGFSSTPGSPILTAFDAGAVVHASRRGWPTQSSTATMALLIGLAIALAGQRGRNDLGLGAELDRIPAIADQLAVELDSSMEAVARAFVAARLILFTGLGPNGATAAFGAAKVRELSPIHAIAFPLEEMHHYRAQKRGDPLFLVASDPTSRERALDTALVSFLRGGRTVALLSRTDREISERCEHSILLPATHPAFAAIVGSIPLHLFAFHFAKARDALGLGYPGAFPDD